jgi:hypothetical protein
MMYYNTYRVQSNDNAPWVVILLYGSCCSGYGAASSSASDENVNLSG